MAKFDVSHLSTMKVEGSTNWNPNDRGNVVVGGVCKTPTYAGIAPFYHGHWKGFDYIRSAVASMGAMPKYDTPAFWAWKKKLDKTLADSPVVQNLVKAFYQSTFWAPNRLDEIKSQGVANWLYDHLVNGGARGARWAQLAARVTPDGDVGPQTIAAINAMPPAEFLARADDIAGKHRLDVAHKDPSQIPFLASWLGRDNQPPEIIAMVKSAAKDGRLDEKEVASLGAAMEAV